MPVIAQGRVLRRLCEFCIFGCRELAFETVKEPVKHKSLTIVNDNPLHALPRSSLGEDSAEHSLRTIDGAAKASQEPLHPRRNIHVRFLRWFRNEVIGRGLLTDLCRHAAEALGAVFSARQGHVGDSASNAAADGGAEIHMEMCNNLHMATNLALDDKLIEEARRVGHHKTKKGAVTAALAEYVRRRKQQLILEAFGTFEFDPAYDYKAERRRRRP